MLIIRKSQTNNLIATVSMNKTLPNPYYLFSFQHIASKERISFYPEVITSNIRYDKFRFVEAPTTNLSINPPQVFFEYLGQYYYSIYENITSGSTDIALAYNKLESGRAWVIVGDDNTQECFFEPYISNDEDFAQVIYVSEEEEACIYPTPSISPSLTSTPISPTPTNTQTNTPSVTPTLTPTPSSTPPAVDPSTLGALWWVDFTDPDNIYVSGSNTIDGAKNLITNLWSFSANTNTGPQYQSNSYFSVSGSARSYVNGLSNALNVFNTSMKEMTIAMNIRWQAGQYGAKIVSSWNEQNYLGQTQGYQMVRVNMNGDIGPSTVSNELNPFQTFRDTNWVTDDVWTFLIFRYRIDPNNPNQVELTLTYNSGANYTFTSRIPVSSFATRVNPIFSILYDGGFVNMTEAMFFDKSLNSIELPQLVNYFSNKYPLQ